MFGFFQRVILNARRAIGLGVATDQRLAHINGGRVAEITQDDRVSIIPYDQRVTAVNDDDRISIILSPDRVASIEDQVRIIVVED